MEIKGVTNGSFFVNQTKNQKVGDNNAKKRDTIEISTEARDLAKADLDQQKIEDIRSKIKSGFYKSDEVLNKVADKILVDIKK
ncbi:flagellar biosynthesis anti-sigma factor FlgM [Stygiobacter electus]|uniref:Flagellar biosynthesis anti-sigma factor FlgM n=1 Tax=Stygiobacter electus TaxID=3032292 RepID=A0AAE3NYS3_9BACT|nr:flagellar biosynthesis anti-sigma factor FlgM [Stygiobacter electus]MDF1611204.1 flagellar biosynthesis anti-sigma factor FlgM [Stygiobacter electus]